MGKTAVNLTIVRALEISKGKTKKLIKRKKMEYESKLARNIKTDCKSFYKYITRKRLSKVNVGPLQARQEKL